MTMPSGREISVDRVDCSQSLREPPQGDQSAWGGPPTGDDRDHWLREARKGDQSAWKALFNECYPKVRRVVRRRLDRSMRSWYDSTDIASDVMKSLAANFDRLSFPSIDSLIAFLAHVAEQKVIDEYRRCNTLKNDISRNRRLTTGDEDAAPVQLPSDEPTASQFAQANEVHEWLLSRSDEAERRIVELRQQGYSTADIAEITGWNIRKVQRILQHLHDLLSSSGG